MVPVERFVMKVRDFVLGLLGSTPIAIVVWFIAFHVEDVNGVVTIVYEEGDLLCRLLQLFGVL